MSSLHRYYYQHLVEIHNGLRREFKQVLQTLPTATQSSSIQNACRNIVSFCGHLELHHDIEEQAIFPQFKAVTDISNWSESHENLHETLHVVRKYAQQGIETKGLNFEEKKLELIKELTKLGEIVLPHLLEEERESHPDITIKLWPTERDFARAFPWIR
eukprot:gene390-458_t